MMFTIKQAHNVFKVINSASDNFTVSSSSGVFLSMFRNFFETVKTLVNQLEKNWNKIILIALKPGMPGFLPSINLPMKSSIARAVTTIGMMPRLKPIKLFFF